MSTIILVRHGEAAGNKEHRFIGQADVPLSEAGHRQARRVADRLAGSGVGRIVASDLQRAVDTARPLAERLGLTIEQDPRLREIANGQWSNLLASEIEASWPDAWARYQGGEDVERPDGERWRDVQTRVVEALVEIASDGPAVVFTHGGPTLLAAVWAASLQAPGNIFRGPLAPVANGSLTTISVKPRRLVALNDIGHLGEVTPDGDLPIWDQPDTLDE